MPTNQSTSGNILLSSLDTADQTRLIANLSPVPMQFAEVLSDPGETTRHVYFPIDGVVSLITPGEGRAQLEIGLVGNEGMLGTQLLLGVDVSPLRALVQGPGHAWRIDAESFKRAVDSSPPMRAAFGRYLFVYIAQLIQTASCTRFHLIEARLARWLLMTRDRAHSNEFHITHEFLACMLGVRRVGVTSAASALQRRKLIRYSRGDIAILDVRGLKLAACPCYALDRKTYSRMLGTNTLQGTEPSTEVLSASPQLAQPGDICVGGLRQLNG